MHNCSCNIIINKLPNSMSQCIFYFIYICFLTQPSFITAVFLAYLWQSIAYYHENHLFRIILLPDRKLR